MNLIISQKFGRHYDSAGIFIEADAVDVLISLNIGNDHYRSIAYDKHFVKTVFNQIFTEDNEILNIDFDEPKMKFIRGKALTNYINLL